MCSTGSTVITPVESVRSAGVEHALLEFEVMGETDVVAPRRATFETATHLYVRFYLEHMHIEETEVLPLAEAVLGAGDWIELDGAFLSNRDPLTGRDAVAVYQPLFARIPSALPAASGVGPALEALAGVGPPRYARRRAGQAAWG